jgi:uncharacterized protein YbaP (TraB family)
LINLTGAPRLPRAAAALLIFCLACLAPWARADEPHHTLWVVKGAHNTIYLLGSVHVLKPGERDLPAEALRAYSKAAALVMEIDLNGLGSDPSLGIDPTLETLPEGETLAHVLGPSIYQRFTRHVQTLGLTPDVFSSFQPWFAAMAMQQAELAQQGFDAASGVDEQFAERAASDHKPIIALETVEQQLGFFAHLSIDQQRRFLLYMLDDADDTVDSADAVVAAWRSGDVARLERLLRESSEQYPELFRMLTTDRNRRWLPTVTGLLAERQDYLVIVGALHLVGQDGLVSLLRQAGYQVDQR